MFTKVLTGIKNESLFVMIAVISLALLASYDQLAFTTALLIVISAKIYLNMSNAIRCAITLQTGAYARL